MAEITPLTDLALQRAHAIFEWHKLIVRRKLRTDDKYRYTLNEVADKVDQVLAHQLAVVMALLRYKGVPDYRTVAAHAKRLGLDFDEGELKTAYEAFGDPQVIENFATPIDRWVGQTISLTPSQLGSVQKRLEAYRSAFRQNPCTLEGILTIADRFPVVAIPVFIVTRAATTVGPLLVPDMYADGVEIFGDKFSDDGFARDLEVFKLDFCTNI